MFLYARVTALLGRHERLNEHLAEAGKKLASSVLQQAVDLLLEFLLSSDFFDKQWHLDHVEFII